MSEIVFFLEEESAKALLQALIPRVLNPTPPCRFVVFEGKQDLEKRLARRMQGYLVSDARFVVLRDQDSGDCRKIKKSLRAKCVEGQRPEALIRIACRELESWYLADLKAVEKGLSVKKLLQLQQKNPYRNPDNITSPDRELARIAPSYQKIGGSRLIGPHLDIANKRSESFQQFINGVRRLAL
ncbi:MAG: DUF4276 family protein [Deltaproteobacteria bacterium]|nr:DUF4276 family protein [Deltaproteobacteria bacterium]